MSDIEDSNGDLLLDSDGAPLHTDSQPEGLHDTDGEKLYDTDGKRMMFLDLRKRPRVS